MLELTEGEIVRFWGYVDKSGGEDTCWSWVKYKDKDGYGNMKIKRDKKGHTLRTHRIAYVLKNGPISSDILVRHSCDNPPCCNPKHLLTGTTTENVTDRVVRGRSAMGDRSKFRRYPELIKRGEQHPMCKTKAEEILRIRADYAAGQVSIQQLMEKYKKIRPTISAIVHRRIWKHI